MLFSLFLFTNFKWFTFSRNKVPQNNNINNSGGCCILFMSYVPGTHKFKIFYKTCNIKPIFHSFVCHENNTNISNNKYPLIRNVIRMIIY